MTTPKDPTTGQFVKVTPQVSTEGGNTQLTPQPGFTKKTQLPGTVPFGGART